MYVGVILDARVQTCNAGRIPHVCGGDPGTRTTTRLSTAVFPMYVGVILIKLAFDDVDKGIPHVCGGDPLTTSTRSPQGAYSPCMWG